MREGMGTLFFPDSRQVSSLFSLRQRRKKRGQLERGSGFDRRNRLIEANCRLLSARPIARARVPSYVARARPS